MAAQFSFNFDANNTNNNNNEEENNAEEVSVVCGVNCIITDKRRLLYRLLNLMPRY